MLSGHGGDAGPQGGDIIVAIVAADARNDGDDAAVGFALFQSYDWLRPRRWP